MQLRQMQQYTVITIIAGLGMFLSTLDSGIVNIAIPSLLRVFKTDLNILIWVVTLYTLVLSSTIMLFGRLADRFGRVNLYQAGLIVFGIGSLLCGFAWNTTSLIVFRGIQGLGAAMLQATAAAIITTYVDKDKLVATMGLFGMMIGLGPLLGPAIGGAILSSIGWQWLFWINIPICLITWLGCTRINKVEALQHSPINWLTIILFAIAMLSMLLTLNWMKDLALMQIWVSISSLVTIGALFLLFINEKRAVHPTIALYHFKQLHFIAPVIGTIALGGATAISFILPPLYFESIHQMPSWQVGLVCLGTPAGLIISSKLTSMYLTPQREFGLMTSGLTVMLIALISLSFVGLTTNWLQIFFILFIYGLGAGCYQTPNVMYVMSQVDSSQQATMGAFLRMIQNVGIASAAAGAALVVSHQYGASTSQILDGIRDGWILAAIFVLVALILFIVLLLKSRESKNA